MHLNHLDLAVPDVAAAATFFQSAFGFTVLETRGRDGMAILRGAGFVLVLTRDLDAAYPKTFHIGFLQPDEQAVLDVYACILTAGFDVPKPPAIMRGSLMFYCTVPGGILVEVSHRPEPD
jgi:lactoylglutathione lyase